MRNAFGMERLTLDERTYLLGYALKHRAVVAKDYASGGKQHKAGEPFDYSELDELTFRGLWMAEYVNFVPPKP